MRKPVNDFEKWYDAHPFGTKTDYGYHEAADLNLKTGGDTDLGQPLFAIADGIVTSVHLHTSSANFGNHIHIKHDGPWGTVWSHYAHCSEILTTEGSTVKEGDLIARVGKSGTVYSHLHFAIKLEPTGIDGIAKTSEDLKKWTNPIQFIEKWPTVVIAPGKTYSEEEYTKVRLERDTNWNLYQEALQDHKTFIEDVSVQIGCSNSEEAIFARIKTLNTLDAQLEDARSGAKKAQELYEQERAGFVKRINELERALLKQQMDHNDELEKLRLEHLAENNNLLDQLAILKSQVQSSQENEAFLDKIRKWLRL